MWWTAWALVVGCGRGPGVYAGCDEPDECEVPEGATAECLEKSGEGFCTWSCTDDAECDDDPDPDFGFVCASFEDTSGQHCFPSCREDAEDEDEVCPAGYGCRSTGGGSENRKVCFPGE